MAPLTRARTEMLPEEDDFSDGEWITLSTLHLTVSTDGWRCTLTLKMINEHRLRKVVSDISVEIEKYKKELETIVVVVEAECECCGLKEECTPAYIGQVEECHSGNWVCGLCCEAVKERLARAPEIAMREAVGSHREFCQKFNATTRLNPKLSLTCTMREIAKRNCENRESSNSSIAKLARSTSCFPDIN